MRVAITGATGFIGSAIVGRLAAAGHRVSALVRPTSRRDHIVPFVDRFIEGDQADPSLWPALLDSADCVIHNSIERSAWEPADSLDLHLQSNLVGSIKFLRASAPRQFIFMSSMAIYHEVPLPQSPPGKVFELPGSYYAAYKAAIEAHIHAEQLEGRPTAIIRPASVYGIDRSLQRSRGHDMILALRRGESFRTPGWSRWVHVEDVAATVVATVGKPGTSGGVYDLVDCYARHADWAVMAAEILGIQANIDFAGPALPERTISSDAARALGVSLNRGRDGIRKHLSELLAAMGPLA